MKAIKLNRPPFGKYMKEQIKTRPAVSTILITYFAFCLASSIYFAVIGRTRDIGYSLVYALAVPAIYIGEYFSRQRTPVLCVAFIIFWLFGSLIGEGYNVYTLFKIGGVECWDKIMHFMWGAVFVCAGFAIIKMFLGEPDTNKKFFAYLLFGLSFCFLSAVVWEIYEFTIDSINPNYDMQADTLVTSIHSFLLHGLLPDNINDHLNTLVVEGIAYTELYDAAGNLLCTIPGGYLDIGIFDTMWDIVWCTVASVIFCIALIIDWFCGKHLYKLSIPAVPQTAEKPVEGVAAETAAEPETADEDEPAESTELPQE